MRHAAAGVDINVANSGKALLILHRHMKKDALAEKDDERGETAPSLALLFRQEDLAMVLLVHGAPRSPQQSINPPNRTWPTASPNQIQLPHRAARLQLVPSLGAFHVR
jgi:hypothetical protein